jgi:hypothetical protein
MTKLFKVEHNAETGEITEIELTAKEIADIKAEAQSQADAEAAKVAEKTALLAKLGITESEAALLLS